MPCGMQDPSSPTRDRIHAYALEAQKVSTTGPPGSPKRVCLDADLPIKEFLLIFPLLPWPLSLMAAQAVGTYSSKHPQTHSPQLISLDSQKET